MDIFTIVERLYMDRSCKWIRIIDSNQIQPFLIQKRLCMNDALRVQTRWLDKYVFSLPPKMYLSLAWSIIPKVKKMPFIKYIKIEPKQKEEFDFILNCIRKQFMLSDNDYNSVKNKLVEEIKKDMIFWFSYYGIKKTHWSDYQLNFNLIKEFGEKHKKTESLEKWGL